ncbi:MAG: hypothetical protein JO121_26640 [Deltaproteobacteria bacterium]|jgi:hypothetical protein|nr:hypothetical protein [Deltaproteobacteria bacterium]
MSKLTAPRPLLVDSPSDSGFATTSWGEQARPRLHAAETEGRLAVLFYVPRQASGRHATCIARMMRSS